MDIMAMDMVNNINKKALFLSIIFAAPLSAKEWTFVPNLSGTETYSDNIRLTAANPEDSFVSEFGAGLQASYLSERAKLNFSGNSSFLNYSHDNSLNNHYETLFANGDIALWPDGLKLLGSANLANISRNEAANSTADIITGDTIQSFRYSTGLEYNMANSHYTARSSIIYDSVTNDDDIGNSIGITALLDTENGNAARNIFWQLNANYARREDNVNNNNVVSHYGENYLLDAKLGLITDFNLNPFIRYFEEKVTGSETQQLDSTPSLGAGLRWLATQALIIDLSYNFAKDKNISDDYVAGQINWRPSERTNLEAGYNQRFFGESYYFDFSHRSRRLTNTIRYSEELTIFDRGNYDEVTDQFWCPTDEVTPVAADCFPSDQPPNNIDDYEIIDYTGLILEQSNSYSLNKQLSWSSTLNLARTDFNFYLSTNEREDLDTGAIDDYFDGSLSITRKLSPRSELTLLGMFRHTIYDKQTSGTSNQEDYYRTFTATYTRALASALSANFTLRYLNRTSTTAIYNYNETRASINLTKDF